MSPPRHVSVADYYGTADVRARIVEWCGGSSATSPTSAYIAVLERNSAAMPSWETATRVPIAEIDSVWERGGDVARSLWDTEHLVVFLEIDYQNIDTPAEPFLRPAEVLFKLERVFRAATALFRGLHLPLRAVVTGRGYHFTGQVPLDHPVVDALASIVPDTPAWYSNYEARRPAGVTAAMSERQARASAGLGCLLEYAAGRIIEQASTNRVPVVLNGTTVGTGLVGRECVSIDFSHAGDPLDRRHVRAGFSTYQWHRLRPDIFGAWTASMVPPMAALPRGRQSLMALLAGGRDLDAGIRAAHNTSMTIPNVASGLARWFARYSSSKLAAFHRTYYAELRANDVRPPKLDLDTLPPCVSAALMRPNDLLLKPEHIQHVVRGLMVHGWTPAQIARLVQSKYQADDGWGDRWHARMDAQTRAEFDVRVFAGMMATGVDALIDFNCVSAQEKDLCPRTGCRHDLRIDRDQLAARLS